MAQSDKKVFAHYMLGLTDGQTAEEWQKEMSSAKALGIDGFALNAGPTDTWSATQLDLAYAAAEAVGFTVFISFDQLCCGAWPVEQVSEYINAHKDSGAQFKVDSKPFVSTFEGGDWASNWASVKSATGPLFLVPNWGNIGPSGIGAHLSEIDGAFSWEAWSKTPGQPKTTASDIDWMNALGSKAYMMPVSPWFYTNLPQWSKNWLWPSDTLWFDRWEQVLELSPEYVEIITWNDFGESHYIADPLRPGAVVAGADTYVNGVPHTAWQKVLPYYISSYKAGSPQAITEAQAVFWYRQTPASACSDGGTTCDQGSGPSAATCVEDAVFIMTLAPEAGELTVSIGGAAQTFQVEAGAKLTKMEFGGKTGAVEVTFAGKSGSGSKEITNDCPASGVVNFNPVVASV
ncbi:glycoside hydrolase [Geopyxis carbonaria]|nr:glycoside hydrolase [Geopyxis carbonaria]